MSATLSRALTAVTAAFGGDARSNRDVPQWEALPGQVKNNAGGHCWEVDDLQRLLRFLILGVEGGTYYACAKKLGMENATALVSLLEAGRGQEVVELITDVSVRGRAAKQDPTLFALAVCARLGDLETRRAAYGALNKICRIPTHLFMFIGFCESMGEGTGWGRLHRRAVQEWYCTKDPVKLAFACTKYRNREGWTHKDVLRLTHAKPSSPAHNVIFRYLTKGWDAIDPKQEGGAHLVKYADNEELISLLSAVERAKVSDEAGMLELIAKHHLAREHIPTPLLGSTAIWGTLLETGMPMTAMIRNLAKMTAIGLVSDLSDAAHAIAQQVTDPQRLRAARIHPFQVLLALQTYKAGHGDKGKLTWKPVQEVVEALDEAFYLAFDAVEPTGLRWLLGVDVSGSMGCGGVNGARSITPMIASAAMAMLAAKTEKRHTILGFSDHLVPLGITARDSLESAVKKIQRVPMGGTDCSLPMIHAMKKRIPVDVFVVYTDCETWAGHIHPAEALKKYRREMRIDAKLIVVAMTSNGFTLADPDDGGMLDIVGFDAGAPSIMREFALGNI